ncbi:hypothetical protein FHX10_003013 [Rhizobium sp. BK591]|nr:hypothetical protein [Rhizobium sp. BK591]
MIGELSSANLPKAYGLTGWILEGDIWVLAWTTLIFSLLFPVACLISWTLILGSRVGW